MLCEGEIDEANYSVIMPRQKKFRLIYKKLERKDLLKSTPIVLCEGDSWFSTPLTTNLLGSLCRAPIHRRHLFTALTEARRLEDTDQEE